MFNSARYCVKCGRGLRFKMRECPWCGTEVENPDKSKYFAWGLIPVLGWIVGLILFFTLQNEYPRRADSAAKGVVTGVIGVLLACLVAGIVLFVKSNFLG